MDRDEIVKLIGNPLLQDARNWFVDNDGGKVSVRALRLNLQGKVHASEILGVKRFHDAHLVSSGIEIVEKLLNAESSRHAEACKEAIRLLNKTHAKDGWEVKKKTSGERTIRASDGTTVNTGKIDMSNEEAEFVNALPAIIKSLAESN